MDECCPKFNPKPWDKKILRWKNKRFVKGRVFTVFNIPLNFGSVMVKMDKMIREANAKNPSYLGLSDHTSAWNMDVYVAESLAEEEEITFNACSHKELIRLSYKDFKKLVKPKVIGFSYQY